jgi:hypothetical protein
MIDRDPSLTQEQKNEAKAKLRGIVSAPARKKIDSYTGADGKRHEVFLNPDGSTNEEVFSEVGVAPTDAAGDGAPSALTDSGPVRNGVTPTAGNGSAKVNCRSIHALALYAEPTVDTIIGVFACGDSLSVLKTNLGPEKRTAEVWSRQGQQGFVYEAFPDFETAGR